MFGLIKQVFIALSSFSESLTRVAKVQTKCLLRNNLTKYLNSVEL